MFFHGPCWFNLPNPAVSMLWKQTKTTSDQKWGGFLFFHWNKFILKPGLDWHYKKEKSCRIVFWESGRRHLGDTCWYSVGFKSPCEPNMWAELHLRCWAEDLEQRLTFDFGKELEGRRQRRSEQAHVCELSDEVLINQKGLLWRDGTSHVKSHIPAWRWAECKSQRVFFFF